MAGGEGGQPNMTKCDEGQGLEGSLEYDIYFVQFQLQGTNSCLAAGGKILGRNYTSKYPPQVTERHTKKLH